MHASALVLPFTGAQHRPRVKVREFLIQISRPDGSVERHHRLGGNSWDHTQDAMERAGIGAVVNVQALDEVAA
jgi:hypothetical protein